MQKSNFDLRFHFQWMDAMNMNLCVRVCGCGVSITHNFGFNFFSLHIIYSFFFPMKTKKKKKLVTEFCLYFSLSVSVNCTNVSKYHSVRCWFDTHLWFLCFTFPTFYEKILSETILYENWIYLLFDCEYKFRFR